MSAGERVRAAVIGCACAAWLIAPAHVDAQDRVTLSYAASDDEAADLERTLSSALDLPELRCELSRVATVSARGLLDPVPGAEPALARIWVDVTGAERAVIYVVDRSWTHTYIRTLLRAQDNTALDHAQIGEIVRSAVQALQEGAVIGIAREQLIVPETSAPHTEPAVTLPPESKSDRFWLGAGLSYSIGLRADGAAIAHGPGAYGYALAALGAVRLGGMLALQYQPYRIEHGGTAARLDTLALRAGPIFETALGRSFNVQLGLAFGSDLVHIDPESDASGVTPDRAHWAAFPLVEAIVGARVPLTSAFELLVALVADADLVDTRYVIRSGAGTQVVEDPWPVRPALRVGLGFN
jgi:hypothetical protein